MKNTFFRKNSVALSIALFIIIIQIIGISWIFVEKKEGHHSDEVASYNFANGWFSGYLYEDMDNQTINMGEWTSGQELRNALEVQKGQQFRYDSVLYNQHKDLSPPLHSLILHTICSFFPDTFSWDYSFFINICAFLISSCFLFLLGKELFKNNWDSINLLIYYGFSASALNTTIYLRMYALLTMFSIIFIYLHFRWYLRIEKKLKEVNDIENGIRPKNYNYCTIELLFIFLITMLGGTTHYYFFILAFFITFFWGCWLLTKKQWKVMIAYFLEMILAVIIVLMAFPTAVSYISNSVNGSQASASQIQMPYSWNLNSCLSMVLQNISGLSLPGLYVSGAIIVSVFICLISFGIPICFLFRRTEYFQRGKTVVIRFTKNFPKSVVDLYKGCNAPVHLLFWSVILSIVVIAKISNNYTMGVYASRYLFFLMPLGAILIYYIIKKITSKIIQKYRFKTLFMCAAVLLCCYSSNRVCGTQYFFQYKSETGVNIRKLTEDANCIYAYDDLSNINCISVEILNCKEFFSFPALYVDIGTKDLETLKDISTPLYLLVEKDAFYSMKDAFGDEYIDSEGKKHKSEDLMSEDEFLEKFSQISYVKKMEYIDGIETIKGVVDIYRLN